VRSSLLLIAVLALAAVVVACTDTPAPTSKGNRAVGVEIEEAGEAKPAPETKAGVVPDLLGVSVGDSRDAIAAAGFEVGTVDTVGLFGTVANNWLVCEQLPQPGAQPQRGSPVDLTADRQC
jgi:PASTA domain